jgi:hypothetical protein
MYPHPLIRQFIYEAESWKRLLAFLRQENVSFKTRLAEIVNDSTDNDLVAAAERFQDEFLSQDRMLLFLSEELAKQNKLLERELYEDGELFKEVNKNQKKLREDFKKAGELFAKVKEAFSDYLVEHF